MAVLDRFGSVVSRYAYTPSGKIDRIFGTADPIRHLYQQGWRDAAGDYDGTILRGGLYHDALTNGVLTISVSQFWGDVTAIEVEPLGVYQQVAISAAVLLGGVAGAVVGGPLGFVGGSMAVASYVGYFNRSEIQGQSTYDAIRGGLADGTGVSSLYAAGYNKDIVTGQNLGLSGGQRVLHGTLGVLSVAPVVGVVGVVGRSAANGLRGLSIGTRTAYLGGSLRGGAFAPAFAFSYPVVTRSAAAASTAATGPGRALALFATTSGASTAGQAGVQGRPSIRKNDVTTYGDFKNRSVVGDRLEGHELLQHAWLKARGLVTTRLGNATSANNPVIALLLRTHIRINAAQNALDVTRQTALQNILANRRILLDNGISRDRVNHLTIQALKYAEELGVL